MIYDCFLFYNELDLLEIRLHELNDVVDFFVLVEGEITFQHAPKPLYFAENKERFSPFLSKIIHVVARNAPRTSTWDTEYFQRNQIMRGLAGCHDDDVVIISDVDEIPSADVVHRYLYLPQEHVSLQQQLYYYYFNCFTGNTWQKVKIMPYGLVKISSIQKLREMDASDCLLNGGWHFSYLGDEHHIANKLRSFAHTNFNGLNLDEIRKNIDYGLDIITDGPPFTLQSLDNLPEYILRNQDKFAHLIRKRPFLESNWKPVQGETAGVYCSSAKKDSC